jgi:hypothetical protein
VNTTVKAGHGVASGQSSDRRFPEGTITMQKALFEERGLNLDGYYLGTINLGIAPHWSFDKKIFYAIYSVYQGNSSTTDSVFSQIVKTPIPISMKSSRLNTPLDG